MYTYSLYDENNNLIGNYFGRQLAGWSAIPEGWSIEEFQGDVSRGMVSHAYLKSVYS